jgi:hypothetical protein
VLDAPGSDAGAPCEPVDEGGVAPGVDAVSVPAGDVVPALAGEAPD